MIKNILYLSAGSYGSTGIIQELRNWEGRDFRIIGVDIKEKTHAKHVCDAYYQVPRYTDSHYVSAIREIVKKEKIDICAFGGHTREKIILMENNVVPIISSDPSVLKITSSKFKTYKLFPEFAPDYIYLQKGDNVFKAAQKLGYPQREICFKPAVSSGGRGFRIIAEPDFDKTNAIFKERTNPYITLSELDSLDFPPLLLMERLKGRNFHIDILAKDGVIKKAVVSYRIEEIMGLGFSLETTNERSWYLKIAEVVVRRLGLSYNCFIQLMGNKLLEIGGRPAGSVPIGQDLVKGAIQLYEGEEPSIKVKQIRMLRHWVPIFTEM